MTTNIRCWTEWEASLVHEGGDGPNELLRVGWLHQASLYLLSSDGLLLLLLIARHRIRLAGHRIHGMTLLSRSICSLKLANHGLLLSLVFRAHVIHRITSRSTLGSTHWHSSRWRSKTLVTIGSIHVRCTLHIRLSAIGGSIDSCAIIRLRWGSLRSKILGSW